MQNQNKPNIGASQVSSSRRGFESDTGSSFISKVSVAFLAFNTFVCAYRAREDLYTLAFIFGFYSLLLLFLWSLDLYNRLQEGAPRKERVKVVLWCLMTVLNFGFAYRVERFLKPTGLSWLLWAVVGVSSLTGFILFYVYPVTVDEKSLPMKNTY